MNIKKIISMAVFFIFLFRAPGFVYAQQNSQEQNKTQEQTSTKTATPTPRSIQDSKQVTPSPAQKNVVRPTTPQQKTKTPGSSNGAMDVAGQLKSITQERIEAQTQIQESLTKLTSRPDYLKLLIGPNYGAIKILNEEIEKNRLRIEDLNKLMAQTLSEDEIDLIKGAVRALEQQNSSLSEQIKFEQQTRSLFGWFVKLFY